MKSLIKFKVSAIYAALSFHAFTNFVYKFSNGNTMLKARLEHEVIYGRCLATNEQVQRGEIVVEELPFAYGPKRDSGIVCLGCYCFLQFGEDGDSLDRCELCDWPLCSVCASNQYENDHRGECGIFAAARVTFAGNVSEDGVCTQLDCITPLRGWRTAWWTCQNKNISFCQTLKHFFNRTRAGQKLERGGPEGEEQREAVGVVDLD